MRKWASEETEKLTSLYIRTDITSDALIKDTAALSRFASKINQQGVAVTEKDVADKLLQLRKSGKLPRLRH